MTEPDDLRFMHGHPMPTRDHATLLASHHLMLELARECLPVSVTPRGETSFFEDWEVTRAALMARLASTLRHLGYLAPSYSRLDGFALARTLVGHVITFAWTSADPKGRLPAFLRSSFKDILAKDGRYRERGDAPLLEDAVRERLSAYTRKVGHELPKLPRLSRESDEYWRERVRSSLPESLHIVNFQSLYGDIYDHFAAYDHPTTTGLQVFAHLAGDPVVATVDGEPERNLVEDLRPYWIAVFAFAEALIVSNVASGRPHLQDLSRALETIGTMRGLERDGRLAVTVTDDGTISIGVAP
ncbi:MAG TPA: hypothetical protein VF257_07850 [Solirubrobacteraceae bacterium]